MTRKIKEAGRLHIPCRRQRKLSVRASFKLLASVLAGKRYSTTAAAANVEMSNEVPPVDGDISLIVDKSDTHTASTTHECNCMFVRWTSSAERKGKRVNIEHSKRTGEWISTVKWNLGVYDDECYRNAELVINTTGLQMTRLRSERDPIPQWILHTKVVTDLSLYAGPLESPCWVATCELCAAAQACDNPIQVVESTSIGCTQCTSMWHPSCAAFVFECVEMRPVEPFICPGCVAEDAHVGGSASSSSSAAYVEPLVRLHENAQKSKRPAKRRRYPCQTNSSIANRPAQVHAMQSAVSNTHQQPSQFSLATGTHNR